MGLLDTGAGLATVARDTLRAVANDAEVGGAVSIVHVWIEAASDGGAYVLYID